MLRLCALLLCGLACAQDAAPPPVAFAAEDAAWGGPERGCAVAVGVAAHELQCALPAGDVTVTFSPTRRRLTLTCHRGSYNCTELQVAREHLPLALSAALESVQVERCAVSEPLACLLALVGASDVASVRLEELRGGVEPAAVRGLTNVTRLRVSVADGVVTSVPFPALALLPALRSFSLLNASLHLAATDAAPPAPLLARLELADGSLPTLPAAAFAAFSAVTELLLWGNSMREIHEDALQGLSELRNLSLNGNSLSHLPGGLLRPARRLRLLHAYKNRLELLPAGLLAGLSDLREVQIFNNNASLVIEEGAFSNLPSLRYLKLDYCGVGQLPRDFLSATPLATLSLTGNNLTTLPSRVFNPELVELNLSRNKIGALPRDAFDGLEHLQSLDLSGNRLAEIPGRLFASLSRLQVLSLRGNVLETLDGASFEGLSSLTELHLSENRLSELRAAVFDPLYRTLQELTAAHNGLRVPAATGAAVAHDAYADDVQSPFRALVRLRALDLRNNSVRAVAGDWRLLAALETLDLAHNDIEELTTIDMWFASGATVRLQHNNISRLEPPPTSDAAAATFLLDHNPFRCDCEMFEYVRASVRPSVVKLKGGACTGPAELRGQALAALQPARLTCAARGCPQSCRCEERPAAASVEVSCQRPPRAWAGLEGDLPVRLRLLAAPGRELRLPLRVKYLDLSGLNLTELPRVASHNLTEIDARGNRLARVPLEADCYVRVARNPLRCDCDAAADLAAFVSRITMFDADNATCDDGASLAALRIDDLCVKRRAVEISVALVGAMLLTVVVLLAVVWRWRFELRLYLLKRGFGAADDDAEYDMFVSYAHEDEEYVRDVLTPRLEKLGLRLCVHERDWTPGDWIPEQIARSVSRSRRTLVVLSRHFLASRWARLEFGAAHARNRVIVLVLDERALAECADAELRAYVRTNTYVRAADPRVWWRLAAAARRQLPAERLGRAGPAGDIERQESKSSDHSAEKLDSVSRPDGQLPDGLKRSSELLIRTDELSLQSDDMLKHNGLLPSEMIRPDALRPLGLHRPDVEKQVRSLHDKLNYALTPRAPPSVYM